MAAFAWTMCTYPCRTLAWNPFFHTCVREVTRASRGVTDPDHRDLLASLEAAQSVPAFSSALQTSSLYPKKAVALSFVSSSRPKSTARVFLSKELVATALHRRANSSTIATGFDTCISHAIVYIISLLSMACFRTDCRLPRSCPRLRRRTGQDVRFFLDVTRRYGT